MKVIISCEHSGEVREAFRRAGHDAISNDILPADDGSPYHIQGCALTALRDSWDMAILHPPCTYLCSSGLHWNKRDPARAAKTEEALKFVADLWEASSHIPKVGTENSIGCISSRFRKPDQIIQPYQFGADASKSTALWLRGLPKLRPTQFVAPRAVCPRCGDCKHGEEAAEAFARGCATCGEEAGKIRPRWANQTNSGQNKLPPSADRWKLRSKTYPGIADAMAHQWGAE